MLKKINAYQFNSLLKSNAIFENYEIENSTPITGNFFLDVEFKNCKFLYKLKINKFTNNTTFQINNCELIQGLEISNSQISQLDIINTNIHKDFIISDLSTGILDFNNCHINKLEFTKSLKNNDIFNHCIELNKCKIIKLIFDSSYIEKPFEFNECDFDEITISNTIFSNEIQIGNLKTIGFRTKDLNVWSSKFNGEIFFEFGEITEQCLFNKVEFNEQLVFERNFKFNKINFSEVVAKYNATFVYNENIKSLTFADSNFQSCFYFNSFITKSSSDVNLHFYGINHGNYSFGGAPITFIDLSCINYGTIIFTRTIISIVWIEQFINYSSLLFKSVKLSTNSNHIFIYDSSLNLTEFENVDFSKFEEVIIAKSDVSNVVFNNSILPNILKLKSNNKQLGAKIEEDEFLNENIYYRESYRQLKIALERQGNRSAALYYKSKEMYYNYKELKFGAEKVLLFLNYISNNYGNSWARGLLFSITLYFVFFLIYNASLEIPFFEWKLHFTLEETIRTFNKSLLNYFKYIASYPNLQIEDRIISKWYGILNLILSRIFISYGIYQTIIAFRKYSNK